MLYDIVMGVLALSFLLAIILEAIMIFVVLQENPHKTVISAPSPRKILKKRKENKAKAEEFKKFETLLNNIDAYDGTDFGQKDIE